MKSPGDDYKFAILAVQNARVDVPASGFDLRDGTQVLTRFPLTFERHWEQWLGSAKDHAQEATLVLFRSSQEGCNSEALAWEDKVSSRLRIQVERIFTMLRLLGPIEYEAAFMVGGFARGGSTVCRSFAQLGQYEITRGCLPWLICEHHLHEACTLAENNLAYLDATLDGSRVRLVRGLSALTTGLGRHYASDRLHEFVRAMEAVIYPRIGRSKRDFIHRCALIGAPAQKKEAAQTQLREAYAMRSDVEHLNDWDRSRTRQMEDLACQVYARLFRDGTLRRHFIDDVSIEAFWRLPEDEIRGAFHGIGDFTALPLLTAYDNFGRAFFRDWPPGWADRLKRRHDPHLA